MPSRRRTRLAAAASMALVLCAAPAFVALSVPGGPAHAAFPALDGNIRMLVLSATLAAAGLMRMIAQKG